MTFIEFQNFSRGILLRSRYVARVLWKCGILLRCGAAMQRQGFCYGSRGILFGVVESWTQSVDLQGVIFMIGFLAESCCARSVSVGWNLTRDFMPSFYRCW